MASKSSVVAGVAAVAALVLVFTNPSLTDFKERMGSQADLVARFTCQPTETGNYLVFSRFEYRCLESTGKYVGVLGNYYQLDKNGPAQS
jgi:hypothetical protein